MNNERKISSRWHFNSQKGSIGPTWSISATKRRALWCHGDLRLAPRSGGPSYSTSARLTRSIRRAALKGQIAATYSVATGFSELYFFERSVGSVLVQNAFSPAPPMARRTFFGSRSIRRASTVLDGSDRVRSRRARRLSLAAPFLGVAARAGRTLPGHLDKP